MSEQEPQPKQECGEETRERCNYPGCQNLVTTEPPLAVRIEDTFETRDFRLCGTHMQEATEIQHRMRHSWGPAPEFVRKLLATQESRP